MKKYKLYLYATIIAGLLVIATRLGLAADLSINEKEAIVFAESIAKALNIQDRQQMYTAANHDLHEAYTKEQFSDIFNKIADGYGKLISYEYKIIEEGSKTFLDGKIVPIKKVWFSVETSKHSKGKYFLIIEIVQESNNLACSGYSYVTFPGGAPDFLK